MSTQAQTMDASPIDTTEARVSLTQLAKNVNPIFVFTSSVLASMALICTAIYFVINLKVAPIEDDIRGIKADIVSLRAEIKELDKKQEQRYNQLLQRQDQMMQQQEQRHNQLVQQQNQIIQYLLNKQK